MTDGRGSLTSSLALVGVALAVVAVALVGAAATGAMPGMGSDAQPDGETVLDRSEQRYATAETVVGDATVTVANGTTEQSVNVSYVLATPDRARVALDGRYIAGTNGSVAWVSADGVVFSVPVPEANVSAAANRSTALADRFERLNRSTLVERVLTLVDSQSAAAVPTSPSAGLPANVSAGGLPADVSAGDVPMNWSTGDVPTNWSAGDLPENWSDRIPTNWSAGDLPENWSDRIPTNWSMGDYPANWSMGDYPANWTMGDYPANWTMGDYPANWTMGDYPANWTMGDYPANWTMGDYPANWSERAPAALANRTPPGANGTAYGDERNYTTEVVGTETVDGRESYVLSVDRANATTPWNVTLWVDSEDYRLHRAEATYREYRLTVSLDTTVNASVRDSTFRPPDSDGLSLAGRTTYDTFDAAQANTSVDLARLGDGYAFANATVVTRSGVTVAVQQYTDGDRSAALVSTAGDLPFGFDEGERVTVDGRETTYVDRDGRSAVVWERDGVTRAVVADRPREDLVALAESVTG